MEQIDCVIIDDNELDRIGVELLLEKYDFINLYGSYANPLECAEIIRKKNIELLFLDIDMPEINGLDFLESLENPPLCIFITSHPEYALDGFEKHALDFILKPAKADRLDRSIARARELLQLKNKALLYDIHFADDYLTIKESHDVIRIKISDIIYLEALKDYTKIITPQKTYLTLLNLKNFFERLPGNRFLRIHRSFAVSVNQIRKMEQNELVVNKIRLPIGPTFRQDVNQYLKSN